jgi:hypothetical protein
MDFCQRLCNSNYYQFFCYTLKKEERKKKKFGHVKIDKKLKVLYRIMSCSLAEIKEYAPEVQRTAFNNLYVR